jgi:hypothetical protein
VGWWNNYMTVKISNVAFSDSGSEMELIVVFKVNSVIFNSDLISLVTCKVEWGKQIAAKVRYMKNIVKYNWALGYTPNDWLKLH